MCVRGNDPATCPEHPPGRGELEGGRRRLPSRSCSRARISRLILDSRLLLDGDEALGLRGKFLPIISGGVLRRVRLSTPPSSTPPPSGYEGRCLHNVRQPESSPVPPPHTPQEDGGRHKEVHGPPAGPPRRKESSQRLPSLGTLPTAPEPPGLALSHPANRRRDRPT